MNAIGFTGTRNGMTMTQKHILGDGLFWLRSFAEEFHHGDCVGADEEAASLAKGFGYQIVGHPPDERGARAFFQSDISLPEKPYLERNHAIVDATQILIACPFEVEEVLRSGTWATIRYANQSNKPIVVISPNGTLRL